MTIMRFSSVMKITGVNPYIHVSAARATALKPGWKKPMPVLVRINGEPKEAWHINMMPMGNGSFYLYLHGDVRKASATKVGDRAKVELRFDETYQNGPRHQMPEWFSIPLSKNPKATRTWNALPPSRQKEILRYFAGLKSETARTRNLEKALRVLRGERARFMARDWQDGK